MSYQGPSMGMPAGWYPDPGGAPQQRYFDGTNWTGYTNYAPVGFGPLQGPVAAAPYWVTPMQPATNGLATASLVLGICAAVIEWGGVLTFAAGVLAVVFGSIGISRAGRLGNLNKGRAVAGLVLGCVGICAYFFWGLITFGILWFI